MPEGIEDPFFFNSMLASGLAQLLPFQERKIIRCWLQKLHSMSANEIRDDYMWFLLRTLQGKKITMPFSDLPPEISLMPLKQALPPNVYEDVVCSFEQIDYEWLNEVSEEEEEDKHKDRDKRTALPPALFLDNQPKPKRGVVCYMAAFSDQNSARPTCDSHTGD